MSDISVGDRWQPYDDEQDAVDAWERRLEGAKVDEDVTGEVLAEEIGDVSEDYARAVWERAFDRVITDSRDAFELDDFPDAHATLDRGGQDEHQSNGGQSTEDTSPDLQPAASQQVSEIQQLKAEVRDDADSVRDADAAPSGSAGRSDTSARDSPETQSTVPHDEMDHPDPSVMSRSELETEVEALRSELGDVQGRLDAVQGKLNRLIQLCLGDRAGLATHDVSKMQDYLTRLRDLDERVTEHDDQLQMVRVDGGAGRDNPDDRARRIRQTLYRKRDDDGKAVMSRDEVDSRLGGGLHRDTVLDAMKRAADGHAAEQENQSYTPINGSCELQPLESVRFHTGEGRGNQSRVTLDLSDSTGAEIRQNLTTKDSVGGA